MVSSVNCASQEQPNSTNYNDDSTTANSASLQPTSQLRFKYTFWESTNARQLFAPFDDEHAILAVHRMVKSCEEHAANATENYGDYAIKYLILRKAYLFALELMNGCSWRKCCTKALQVFSDSGFKTIKNCQTIMKWNRHFRVYKSLMPIRSKQTKEFEPKLFSVYPEAKMAVNLYFSKNLETVNVDEFRSFLLDVALPKIILDANSNTLAEPIEIGELLTSINI
jgi:hypothetical protein